MGKSSFDANWRPTLIGVDHSTFTTPIEWAINSTTHAGLVDVQVSALPTGAATSALQTTGNNSLAAIAGLTPTAYDYLILSYTGSRLDSVVYKLGGSGGTVVQTITLDYTGSNLTSVAKT